MRASFKPEATVNSCCLVLAKLDPVATAPDMKNDPRNNTK